VKRLFDDYMEQRAAGQDPVFDPALFNGRAKELEGWKEEGIG